MIDPFYATTILCALAFILIILLPMLDAIPKLTKFVSFRWTCVAIILLIMVAVIINFKELADDTRNIVVKGGLIVVGVFLILKTIEKILYNGWLKGVNLKGSVEKGEWKGGFELSSPKKEAKDQENNVSDGAPEND